MRSIRARVFVRGRVQGVWFRESTREHASTLGLTGWVRNLRDGRVEALFEGDCQSVDLAIDFVQLGPAQARVEEVEVVDYQEGASTETAFRVTIEE